MPRSRFVREVLESLLDYVKLLFMVVIMARFAWVLLVSLLLHLSLLEAVSTWGAWREAPEPEPVKASVGVKIVRPKPMVHKPVKPQLSKVS
ncbi:MAG TPA: hypothetical protein EYM25_06170, partial [Deltaproteobacteria bacterium]|nr:hypothetical protein [Deltaproteobacteria bacterium]